MFAANPAFARDGSRISFDMLKSLHRASIFLSCPRQQTLKSRTLNPKTPNPRNQTPENLKAKSMRIARVFNSSFRDKYIITYIVWVYSWGRGVEGRCSKHVIRFPYTWNYYCYTWPEDWTMRKLQGLGMEEIYEMFCQCSWLIDAVHCLKLWLLPSLCVSRDAKQILHGRQEWFPQINRAKPRKQTKFQREPASHQTNIKALSLDLCGTLLGSNSWVSFNFEDSNVMHLNLSHTNIYI